MKARSLLIIMGVLCFTISMAGQGGPDQFGYTWMDNLQTGGPAYSWIDIVSPENKVDGLADDNVRGPFYISTGLNDYFTYYWYPVDQFWIGSNGYIAFNSINLASVFPYIPDSVDNKHNFISALLTDLTFSGVGNPGACYYYSGEDSVIISYINVPFYAQNAPYWTGSNTFQIILNKIDFSITVNYQSQTGTAMTSTDVKAGMENNTGTIGLQAFASTYPTAGYTIKYYYPTSSNYFVRDGGVKYNSIPYSRGVFLPSTVVFPLTTYISNMGNLPIPPGFTANCSVTNASGTTLMTDTYYYTDTLPVQHDSLLTYFASFIPVLPGTYSYTTTLSGIPGDAVAGNNAVTQELEVIDTSQAFYDIGYCDNTPDATGISWVDGTGGVGMYFEPPSYPVKINNIQFYILSNTGNVNCYIKILDDDGINGSPGTVLDSVYVIAPVGNAWNTVNYASPVVINSGGFYVGWEMGGLNVTMAVDKTSPISHRSFEIISGAWSEYRDGLTQDFMIKCHLQKAVVEDVGILSMVDPQSNDSVTDPLHVKCRIKNFGYLAESNFQVHYQFPGQSMVTQAYSGTPLQPGDSVLFTFSNLFVNSLNQNSDLCVWTSMPYDANQGNDSICVNITTVIYVGIPDPGLTGSFKIFPNPFSRSATIEFPNPGNLPAFLQISDVTGRVIKEIQPGNTTRVFLERGKLSPGIYLLQLLVGNSQYISRLVVE
ncbi:MAG: T9SS type A sorting domain-containing protein [Bacteroidetes bacterium]|nr:T9SS type A sorting domain-containing protein [Bacteroidota bacterium]